MSYRPVKRYKTDSNSRRSRKIIITLILRCNPGHQSGHCSRKISRNVTNGRVDDPYLEGTYGPHSRRSILFSIISFWKIFSKARMDLGHLHEPEFTRVDQTFPRIKLKGISPLRIVEVNELPRSNVMIVNLSEFHEELNEIIILRRIRVELHRNEGKHTQSTLSVDPISGRGNSKSTGSLSQCTFESSLKIRILKDPIPK